MTAMRLPDGVDIVNLKSRLYEQHRIEIPLFEWNGMKLIQASDQGYNTHKDMETLPGALGSEI